MTTTRAPLTQAMLIRSIRASYTPPMNGHALACLRRRVLAGDYDEVMPPSREFADTLGAIEAVGVEDMPPDPEYVALLIEALSQRLGAVGHAAAWASIGIGEHRGRGLLSRFVDSVDWPVWKTLRDAAMSV